MKAINTLFMLFTCTPMISCINFTAKVSETIYSSDNIAINGKYVKKIKITGDLETKELKVANFGKISVSNDIDLEIIKGKVGTILVETYSSVFDYIETFVEDNTLFLRVKNGTMFNKNSNITITVPVNYIDGLKLNGVSSANSCDDVFSESGVTLTLTGASLFNGHINTKNIDISTSGTSKVYSAINTMNLNLKCTGASSYEGSVKSEIMDVYLGGTSEFNACGEAVSSKIKCSGASDFRCKEFDISNLTITLSGTANARLGAIEVIENAVLSGASNLYYRGDAVIKSIQTSGVSSIKRL